MNSLITYTQMIEAQRKNNWQLLCKPSDAVEFKPFDFWKLPLERKTCKWEIKTTEENTKDSSTTLRSLSVVSE